MRIDEDYARHRQIRKLEADGKQGLREYGKLDEHGREQDVGAVSLPFSVPQGLVDAYEYEGAGE